MKTLLITLLILPFTIKAQTITTIAGNGYGATTSWYGGNCTGSYGGDGNPAISASLDNPHSVAVDGAGNVYIADGCNHRIRKINTSGIISTVAGSGATGSGAGGFSGDGGAATAAKLNNPRGLTIDKSGNIYFADYSNNRIRKINSAGIITTIAGDGTFGSGGLGGPATAAQLFLPTGVVVSSSGMIYISDFMNTVIYKIDALGIISLAVSPAPAYGFAVDDSENIYFANEPTGVVWKKNAVSGISTIVVTGLNHPFGVALDKYRNIYIANSYGNTINKINVLGSMDTIAGNGTAGYSCDGCLATDATLNFPSGVAVDENGNIYIAEFYNQRVRKVSNPFAAVNFVNANLLSIEVYPNPSCDVINVKSSGEISNVEIINITGKRFFYQECNLDEIQINIESLPSGMYFVKVNKQFMRKIVKK